MTPGTIGIIIALGATAVMAVIIFIRSHVVVCAPNEAVIFSGRKRGFRVIRGGRGFRRPLIETVSRISLNTIPIEVKVQKALSAGMISLDVEGLATVKVSGEVGGGLDQAVERFLGKSEHEIQTVARQTLEGSLRGVLATRTPEAANAERLAVADSASDAAQTDFARLGLVLDTFKIQHLSDSEGYLEAIGRQKSAEVRRDALQKEATADAEARSVAAEAKRSAVVAETEAEQAIVDAEHEVRMRRAERSAKSNEAEEVAEVARAISRARQQSELEDIRVERNQKREKANTVIPAEAASRAKILAAEGAASKIRENGKATAAAIEQIKMQWTDETAREIMLLQMLPHLVDKVTHVLHDNLHVERLTVVDNGDGGGVPSHVRGLTGSVAAFLEQLKTATGVDVPALLSSDKRDSDGPAAIGEAEKGAKRGSARGPLGHSGH